MSLLRIFLGALAVLACAEASRPEPKAEAAPGNKAFYIFGYGSLLHEGSRIRTNCDITLPEFEIQTIIGNSFLKFNGEDANAMAKRVAACDNADIRPVRVTGIRRAWNAPGVRAKALQGGSFSTSAFSRKPTFLGATVAGNEFIATGVVYKVTEEQYNKQVKREQMAGYDVKNLDTSKISFLDGKSAPSNAQIIFFASNPSTLAIATPEFPIVQSYVDIWLAGALQLQRKFKLEGEEYRKLTGHYSFVNDTASNTYDWSEFWINDRVYPFRPFIAVPDAASIDDALLNNVKPYILQAISFP
uniref:Gamma-glutamylcyclotransferase n=1 Tax=Tetradesmus obliquus TaxID=3088 RepID=A0A383W620_TETOB|eukprot:jgi/Sobl393_1/3348/SZX72464.1